MISAMNKLFYVLLLGLQLVYVATDDINDFFPDINGNLTKITWANEVNNLSYLDSSLNSSVLMLQGDVILGHINGSAGSDFVMGRPPATDSDITLDDYLIKIYYYDRSGLFNPKGVKLHFESTDVFIVAWLTVAYRYGVINFPLVISADIISGPLNATAVPVDADSFLTNAQFFNHSVLSLGWTTTAPGPGNEYTAQQIDAMVDAISRNQVQQDVTFSVRAGIAANSLEQIKRLKDEVSNSTLTIWSSDGDDVDVPNLRELIFYYGVERVFIDVPEDLYNQLDLGNN